MHSSPARTRGIGFKIAQQLGSRDYVVWLSSRKRERGAAAAAELRKKGIEANCLLLNVSANDSLRIAAEHLQGEIVALDALVNNASINFGLLPPPSEELVDRCKSSSI